MKKMRSIGIKCRRIIANKNQKKKSKKYFSYYVSHTIIYYPRLLTPDSRLFSTLYPLCNPERTTRSQRTDKSNFQSAFPGRGSGEFTFKITEYQ